MAGKLAPGRRSDHGVNAGAGGRYQVARFGGPPPGLPEARPGLRGWKPVHCFVGRGAIPDAGTKDAG
jgi:hypothetical protein